MAYHRYIFVSRQAENDQLELLELFLSPGGFFSHNAAHYIPLRHQ